MENVYDGTRTGIRFVRMVTVISAVGVSEIYAFDTAQMLFYSCKEKGI